VTIVEFANLFEEFRASSWDAWRAILTRLTPNVREFIAICGRGSGKSRIVALLACFFASREYRTAPGEFIYIGVFAPDRKQAAITHRYIVGLLKSVAALTSLIIRESRDSVELSNRVIIEVITASTAAPRGRAYVLAIIEECAFLPVDQSANPDVELVRAITPALARVPGSLLALVSSPYARRGVLFSKWKQHHNAPADDVLLVQAATATLNPTFDMRAIARALTDDPASASAEYLAEFRTDVAAYVDRDALEACIVPGRHELPPVSTIAYDAVVDPSGGSSDSFTVAIGHRETRDGQTIAVLDALRERRPPFSPADVVREYAQLLKTYGITTVRGDKYAGEFPRELFREHGVSYDLLDHPKSSLYVDALALINSGRVDLLDHTKAITQLASLERRTSRGARDVVDHPPAGHDDLANVVAALAVSLAATPQHEFLTW
jgi:hypothetical protein